MTETYADCLRLLPDRSLGSFHRLRDLRHWCPLLAGLGFAGYRQRQKPAGAAGA
jgi:hypothetical protein